MPRMTLEELARLIGGRLAGDPSRAITGAASPDAAGPGDLTFVFGEKAGKEFLASKAGAAVVPEGFSAAGRDVVHVRNPQAAMPAVLAALYPETPAPRGVHASAVVHPTAVVAADASVGPHAVVDAGAVLEAGAVVGAGCYVGPGCRVGERSRLHAHAVLYANVQLGRDCIIHSGAIVGADGFGYVRTGARHVKIPQVGGVVVGDDVEIGANACVDRGTLSPTTIGTNTKIDNLVQIGHNCRVGERVIFCGQAALAGSTIVEDDVVLAGQVGVAGHLRIGRGVVAGAQTGIIGDVEPGAKIAGYPAMPIQDWRRMQAISRHLPEMRSDVRSLLERVAELEAKLAAARADPA